jgi:peptidoglycan/LPS O-acetylase OafA/YrhL
VESARDVSRIGWLDGLRGLAAVQVVLLHYISAFFPWLPVTASLTIQSSWWRSLVGTLAPFIYSGSSAVYLFFIMSGVALTQAFAGRPFAFLSTVARRVVRLGLPMTAAVLLGGVLFAVLPDAHLAAAERSGSPWLRDLGPQQTDVASIAHQIAFEGLLAGYRGWSLLPAWTTRHMGLMPLERGVDAPLWTLHLEFCGSLLVMLLVAVRASMSRMVHRTACSVLAYALVLSPLGLFILGHIAAGYLQDVDGSRGKRSWRAVLGAVSLTLGIPLCTLQILGPISILQSRLPAPPLGLPGDGLTLQKMIGAALVFGGLALLPGLQRQIGRPALRWLGKISFSLYLTHFPLAFTCVAAGLVQLDGHLPHDLSITFVSVAGIAASLVVAVLFERCIDRPSVMLSRMIGVGHVARSPALGACVGVGLSG